MDPFKLLSSDIFDRILQHLTLKETLSTSLVSTVWDEVIGSSFIAMGKIKIKISWQPVESFFGEVSHLFVESPRKYQHLEFEHQSSYKNSIKLVCNILGVVGRKFRSVSLKRVTFQSMQEIRKLFNLIEQTVESLEIEQIYIVDRLKKNFNGLQFPKLKTLYVKHMDLFFIDAFKSCKKLKNITISSDDPLSAAVVAFKEILKNNNLTSLEISSRLFKKTFSDEDISVDITFKLNNFVASELFKVEKEAKIIQTNFYNFLRSQMKSLETLKVDVYMGIDTLKIMFQMEKLTLLSINGLNDMEATDDWLGLQFHINKSIKSLTFRDINIKYSVFKALIDATPNLEYLEVHSLDQNSVEYLSRTSIHLKSLKIQCFTDETNLSCPSLFPKLEEFSVNVILSDFEDAVKNIPVNEQNQLVKLMLDSSSSYTILH
jgi:hypothetical protein